MVIDNGLGDERPGGLWAWRRVRLEAWRVPGGLEAWRPGGLACACLFVWRPGMCVCVRLKARSPRGGRTLGGGRTHWGMVAHRPSNLTYSNQIYGKSHKF